MNTMHQLLAQSRTSEVARAAGHPARLAEHEVRLAGRGGRTTRRGDDVAAAHGRRPAATAWLAALVAAVT